MNVANRKPEHLAGIVEEIKGHASPVRYIWLYGAPYLGVTAT